MISRISIDVLLAGGAVLLFAPDAILRILAPGFPPNAAWIRQLIAAARLGVAAMNWLQRSTIPGGIHGRPIVTANLVLCFVSAMSLVRARLDGVTPAAAWLVIVPLKLLAAAYAALLLRCPLDPLGGRTD